MAEIKSLARGIRILELLAQAEDGVTVTEMAEALDVNLSSASRLANTLATYGLAERDGVTRRYRLGTRLLDLSQKLLNKMPIREMARPFLQQLVAETGECAHLGIYREGDAGGARPPGVLYVAQAESPATLRVNAEIGSVAPLHCTALGKALLAFGPYPLPQPLTAHTNRTITDAARLRPALAQIRAQGYAIDDEEYDYGVRCIAVPVYDGRGAVVGSLGISGPATRMAADRLESLAGIVVAVGAALSQRMGYRS